MTHYTISFFLQKTKTADFEFQLILYSRIETARHLVRSDFLQRSTQTLSSQSKKKKKKNWRNSKRTQASLSLSLSLYLSIRRWNVFTLMCMQQSLYLSLHLQTRFGSRSDPNGIQNRMFRQFKNVCIRKALHVILWNVLLCHTKADAHDKFGFWVLEQD